MFNIVAPPSRIRDLFTQGSLELHGRGNITPVNGDGVGVARLFESLEHVDAAMFGDPLRT
jgi:hypothetical protein